jgi:non-ribosomal peptide synthetase component F/acyl carrier protein
MNWAERETGASIPDRFALGAARHPERAAIADGSSVVTYGELSAIAAAYAEALAASGTPGARVALLLADNHELVPAALAALECGMSILTLNAGDPAAHLALVREELEPELLVTTAPLLDHARAAGFDGVPTVDLSAVKRPGDGALSGKSGVDPDATAVLISTSGSTGTPKLVPQSHRNVLHNVLRYTNGLGIRDDDRIALLAALSGGQGFVTTWAALLNGATLCTFPIGERGVAGLADWLAENEVTVFDTIPSVLRNFTRTLGGKRVDGVRLVRLASEAADRSDFDAFRAHFSPDCQLASVLASSECGITAQALFGPDDDPGDGPLPVGYPAEGIAVALENARRAPTALGEVGELVVRSRYLSPGYWRGEPFVEAKGIRKLRTGDLARRGQSGMLEIVGRVDRQVKVRGYRLQLEAVERAIASQPGVGGAAVMLTPAARGGDKLTAFFTTAPGAEVSPAALRRSLRGLLPAHAVPASFVELDSLPLTAHGKLDRDLLAELDLADGDAGAGADDPLTETEELLAGLWADALGRALISVDERFLDLGGDSLDAATIAAGVDELFGVDLELRAFAENPTVTDLAALVDSSRAGTSDAGDPPLRHVPRPGPLSFSQARFLRQGAESSTRWNVTVPFTVRGPLDVELLQASIARLVDRHEILRTTYAEREGRVVAVVGAAAPPEFTVEELDSADDAETRLAEIVAHERRRPFDLERGPLVRWHLLQLGEDEHRLVRTSHHILHDAVSWSIFFDELGRVYEGLLGGKQSPLGPAPQLQYVDYAAWERATNSPGSRRHVEEVDWWQRVLDQAREPAPLPFARSEPDETADPHEDVVAWGLPAKHGAALDAIGRRVGATYYMTRLAAFASLLALETAADDLLVGTPVSTRTRPELQRMFGPFINFRPLRLAVDATRTFPDVLADVRRTVIDTSAYSRLPWEHLMRELGSRGVELPSLTASFSAWSSAEQVRFGGLEIEPLPRPCGESSGFRVGVNRRYEADRCWADFDPRLYAPADVEAFLGRLQELIAAVCKRPETPLHDLQARRTRRRSRAGTR